MNSLLNGFVCIDKCPWYSQDMILLSNKSSKLQIKTKTKNQG